MDAATVSWIARAVRGRWWLVVAILLVVLAIDVGVTLRSPRMYQARASLLIGPSTTVDPGQLVYSVDALGRAMIVGTYANVLDTDLVRREAIEQADAASDPADPDIQVRATALADSAVVQVTAVAPDPRLAADVANAVGRVGQLRMSQLYPMYALTIVTQATPPTKVFEPDVKRNLSLGLLLGVLGGVGLACVVERWKCARW
jgi:succinoglycan biosynthesis transport protein ExoP